MNSQNNRQTLQQENTDAASDAVISVRDVTVAFGRNVILDKLDLDIRRGEVLGFIGPSGSGKSVLMRTILGLTQKKSGLIDIFGQDVDKVNERQRMAIDMRMGVLFQQGALFSSLTVLENIQVPMREYLDLPPKLMNELARLKIDLVGLKPDTAEKYPSELSGGMIKRAALARALALDPEVVFLDEPTSGLDPIGAADFDDLIANLRDTMGLTVYMVTHDLDSLFAICDRIAVLGQKKVLVDGTVEELLKCDDPWVQTYFNGKRARQIDKNAANRRKTGSPPPDKAAEAGMTETKGSSADQGTKQDTETKQ
ncbi:ABC transporter ATP-binding protein [Pseudochrobactrum asaccharolyticum]|uniref:Phospholipid/cholesterol/gamma-HCH transport system ATP-binding protein n=1 Tax=Pseudochrobactrum asaccharolyticum TaxID=354351 RepID=A0A366E9L1_9HYPH|nr:ABC transporter ATP-binding protein [Pseudochrobactrum asaccharolyticum]RBO99012.1 phospholipid/cholesterol/gamma-HCH transport system ATP-binding protein [Pseudochrobactrum asaccharolyticum]